MGRSIAPSVLTLSYLEVKVKVTLQRSPITERRQIRPDVTIIKQ